MRDESDWPSFESIGWTKLPIRVLCGVIAIGLLLALFSWLLRISLHSGYVGNRTSPVHERRSESRPLKEIGRMLIA